MTDKKIDNFLYRHFKRKGHTPAYILVPPVKKITYPFQVVLGWAYRGLTGGFPLLQNFSVAISVSPHVCFILVLILISMFLR